MATALCYLNDVEEGGGTRLTKANVDISAKKGKLLVFWNVQENTNIRHYLAEHAGMPVIKGYKYAFNLWFRECSRNMLYRDFNPKYYEILNDNVEINDISLCLDLSDINPIDNKNGVYKIRKFVSDDDKNSLLSKCNFDESKERSACWIKKELFPNLTNTVKSILKTELVNIENFNVVRYAGKCIHREHYDAYDLNSDTGKKHTERLGQRVATFSVIIKNTLEYGFSRLGLNDVLNEGGGELASERIFAMNQLKELWNRVTHEKEEIVASFAVTIEGELNLRIAQRQFGVAGCRDVAKQVRNPNLN